MSQILLPTSRPSTDLTALAAHLGLPVATWDSPSQVAYTFADHALRALAPSALEALATKHPALGSLAREAAKLRALPETTRGTLEEASTLARVVHREVGLLRWDAEDYLSWRRGNVVPDKTARTTLAKAEETAELCLLAYQVLVLTRDALRTAGYTSWSLVEYEGHYATRTARICRDLADLVTPFLAEAA